MSGLPRPTDVELQILTVFWEHGPCTVREVHNHISEGARHGTSYSTTLKMIQVLHAKEYLTRDETVRPQVYQPTVSREQTQQHLLRYLTERLFGGAVSDLVQCAISSGGATSEELREMQILIEQARKDDSGRAGANSQNAARKKGRKSRQKRGRS